VGKREVRDLCGSRRGRIDEPADRQRHDVDGAHTVGGMAQGDLPRSERNRAARPSPMREDHGYDDADCYGLERQDGGHY